MQDQSETELPEPIGDDDFEVMSPEETYAEFSTRSRIVGDNVTAYGVDCEMCGREVIAFNQNPQMFTINICQPDGVIFVSRKACMECSFEVLKPSPFGGSKLEN